MLACFTAFVTLLPFLKLEEEEAARAEATVPGFNALLLSDRDIVMYVGILR